MKKPHLDFPFRPRLDGSEELYTQNKNYRPPEQKFTLDQVRDWVIQHQRQLILTAQSEGQTQFPLIGNLLFPSLADVFFEKLKLTYNQDYHFDHNTLIFLSTDISIEQGDQISIKYYQQRP